MREPRQRDEIRFVPAGFGELIDFRQLSSFAALFHGRRACPLRAPRLRRKEARVGWRSTILWKLASRMSPRYLRSWCLTSTAPNLFVAWTQPRSGSARLFSPTLVGRERSAERSSRNGTAFDLCERLSACAKAQDRVGPFFCLNSAAIPLPAMEEFVATAILMFPACGVPSIRSIRIELARTNRPIIIETRGIQLLVPARSLKWMSSLVGFPTSADLQPNTDGRQDGGLR